MLNIEIYLHSLASILNLMTTLSRSLYLINNVVKILLDINLIDNKKVIFSHIINRLIDYQFKICVFNYKI